MANVNEYMITIPAARVRWGQYNEKMRRALAIMLLLVIGSTLMMALLSAQSDPEAILPACCRGDGKHGCSMMMRMRQVKASFGGVTLRSGDARCPLYPSGKTTSAAGTTGAISQAQAAFTPCYHSANKVRQIQLCHRNTFDRASHKRGPPFIFS